MFLYKNLFFFNIFCYFNPNHAYWNQRRLFSGNLPGMFNIVPGQNSPRQNNPKLQNILRQNNPRQNSPKKTDKAVPDKIVPNKILKQM